MNPLILKIIGGGFVMLGAFLFSIEIKKKFAGRTEKLRQLQKALGNLSIQIGSTDDMLWECLEKSGEGALGCEALFQSAAEMLKQSERCDPEEVWQKAVMGWQSGLDAEDLKIIQELGTHLGNTDRSGQETNIKNTVEKLALQEQAAAKAAGTDGNMFAGLSLALGALLIILFI